MGKRQRVAGREDGEDGDEDGDAVAVPAVLLRRLPLPSVPLRAGAAAAEEAGEDEEEGGSLAARRNAALLRHQTSVPSQVAASVEERGAA